jgi:energy-dependent translational throttle protein EttA
MAQYVFTMNRVSKVVPPKRVILKDISLSFFPGAKIGVLGVNGSGKSSLLKIMAGVDKEYDGEATPMPNLNIGFLQQEPQLNPEQTVREAVEEGLGEVFNAQKKLDEIYAAYAEPDADFDKLAAEQAKYEALLANAGSDTEHQLEIAADALRLPPWDAKIDKLSGGEKRRVALVPAAVIQAGHAAARRADQPPRCRERGLAGAVPVPLSRHRGGGDP